MFWYVWDLKLDGIQTTLVSHDHICLKVQYGSSVRSAKSQLVFVLRSSTVLKPYSSKTDVHMIQYSA